MSYEKTSAKTNWNYDLASLPGRADEGKSLPDACYESAASDFCVVNYSVTESSDGAHAGFIAVLENKAAPRLAFSTQNFRFPNEAPFIASNLPFFAALVCMPCKDLSAPIETTVIFDMAKKRFAFAPFHQAEKRALHPLTEEKKGLFLINRDGSKRNVSKLTFYPFEKFASVKSAEIKMNMFGNIQVVPKF